MSVLSPNGKRKKSVDWITLCSHLGSRYSERSLPSFAGFSRRSIGFWPAFCRTALISPIKRHRDRAARNRAWISRIQVWRETAFAKITRVCGVQSSRHAQSLSLVAWLQTLNCSPWERDHETRRLWCAAFFCLFVSLLHNPVTRPLTPTVALDMNWVQSLEIFGSIFMVVHWVRHHWASRSIDLFKRYWART